MTIPDLRVQTIKDLGLTSWFGSAKDFSELSVADQARVTDAMSAYVAAHPNEYSAGQVGAATKWNNSGIVGQPVADDSLTAESGVFFNEVGAQASSLNQNLNPFSPQNRKWVLLVLGVGAVLYFFTPQVRAIFSKKAKP